MTIDPNAQSFRSQDPEPIPVSRFTRAEDILEAMLQSIEVGDMHLRPILDAESGNPFPSYFEIGLALRQCLEDKSRRDYLIERLRPHLDYIIGILPAGMQAHGLLPAPADVDLKANRLRPLEEIADEEIRRWVIADGSLIYGELKRYEIENYFDVIRPLLPANAIMYDLGSGLGKVVMSAAVSLPLARCTGVEILNYRHRMACERLAAMLAVAKDGQAALDIPLSPDAPLALPVAGQATGKHVLDIADRIKFIEQDMFAVDIRDADLVFIYSTCFGSFMHLIAERLAQQLRPGCLVSTFTYELLHPAFQQVAHFQAGGLAWTHSYLYRVVQVDDTRTPAEKEWEARVRQEFAAIDSRAAEAAATAA